MKWTVYNVVLTFVVFSNSPLNGVFSWWGSWSLINLNWPRIVMGNPPLSPPRKYLRLYQTYIFIIEERENKGAHYRNCSGCLIDLLLFLVILIVWLYPAVSIVVFFIAVSSSKWLLVDTEGTPEEVRGDKNYFFYGSTTKFWIQPPSDPPPKP